MVLESVLTLLTLNAISINSRFEGGSAGPVTQVSETHFRVGVAGQADQDKRNRQASWYYFRIDGAKGRPLTIDLVDLLGEYNYKSGVHAVTRDTRPVWSVDDRTWRHFESIEWDDTRKELRVRVTPTANRLWIAHVPPYTTRHLAAMMRDVKSKVQIANIGRTVDGRDIPLLTINGAATGVPVIWIMARQHAWETGTSFITEAGIRFLLSDEGNALRESAVWKIFPMADPDGCARGHVRYNVNGFDLNRNWDNVDERLMPEIAAQKRAMLAWIDGGRKIDLFVTLHNQERTDHLEGMITLGGFQDLGTRIYQALKQHTSFSSTLTGPRDSPATTTPGKKGRMNVNQGLFAERRVPAFLLETSVEAVPTLNRPRTVADWHAFGRGLVRALHESVTRR